MLAGPGGGVLRVRVPHSSRASPLYRPGKVRGPCGARRAGEYRILAAMRGGRAACIKSAEGATGPGLLSHQPWAHDGQQSGAVKRLSHPQPPEPGLGGMGPAAAVDLATLS